jgi:hypothetical protein
MKKKAALILPVILIIVIALSLSSCGKAVEKIAEKAVEKAVENNLGENSDVKVDDTGVVISNEQGEVQSGGNATVPEGWPSEAPTYPDIKVTYSAKTKDENKNDNFAIFAEVTKGTVKDVYEWHKSKMTGWEVKSDNFFTTDGKDSFSLQWKNDKYEVLLMVGLDGNVTSYTMTIVQPVSE